MYFTLVTYINQLKRHLHVNKYIPLKWSYASFIAQLYLRTISALAVNCWVIIHCLEVSFKDQIMSP